MISFMHCGGPSMASYRYRAELPAKWLGAEINNPKADIHVYSKPIEPDVEFARKAKSEGKTVIVDICDIHFDQKHYRDILIVADLVTCNTQWTAAYLQEDFGIEACVIPEPFEYEEQEPHCTGSKVLWFGGSGNFDSLERVKGQLTGVDLTVVCNVIGATPWSPENQLKALTECDIVIIPETAPYKSANRAVEAIRSGCFVVAEPHPSLNDFPIYIGNLKKGIEWAIQNPTLANEQIKTAQSFISKRLSPEILENAWRTAIQTARSCLVSDQAISIGQTGSASI